MRAVSSRLTRAEDAKVSPPELLFDLVFVFALTQVTAFMAADPTFAQRGRGPALVIAAVTTVLVLYEVVRYAEARARVSALRASGGRPARVEPRTGRTRLAAGTVTTLRSSRGSARTAAARRSAPRRRA